MLKPISINSFSLCLLSSTSLPLPYPSLQTGGQRCSGLLLPRPRFVRTQAHHKAVRLKKIMSILHTRSGKAHAKSRSQSSSHTGDSTNLSLIAYGAWGDKKKQKQVARAAKRHIFDGADPNACDHNGFTALHWAAKYNWVQLIDVLVTSHRHTFVDPTDVNVTRGVEGKTPLHMAVQFRSLNAIRSLLKYGANLHALYEGMTPIDMAIEEEDEEIFQIMSDFNPKLMETEYSSNVVDEDPDFLTMTANLDKLTGGKNSELAKLAKRYSYMEDTVQTETGRELMERSPSNDDGDDDGLVDDDDENSILHLQRELEELEAMEALLLTREKDKQDEEDKKEEEDDEEAKVSVMRAPTAQNFGTKKKTNKRRLKRATAIRR